MLTYKIPKKRQDLFFRWLSYVARYWKWMLLAFAIILSIIIIEISVPRIVAFVIDDLLGSKKGSEVIIPFLGSFSIQNAFLLVSAVLTTLILIKSLLIFCRTVLLTKVGESIHVEIRGSLFAHLHKLPISYFDTGFTGKIMARITTDADALWALLVHGMVGVIAPIMSLIIIIWVVSLSTPILSLTLLVILPIFTLFFFQARKRAIIATSEQRETLSHLYNRLQEQISGIRTVRIYGMANEENKRFREILGKLYSNNMELMKTFGILAGASEIAVGFGSTLILGIGGWFAFTGAITVGQLVQYYAYAGMLFMPIQQIATTLAQAFSQAEVALVRIFELMDQEPAREFQGGQPCPELSGQIEIEGVNFSYVPERTILKDISLRIPAQATVAFVGHSGSGKSTLVNLICRFYDFQSGRIMLDGLDLTTLEADSYRAQVSYVAQDTFLFSGTVYQNIEYACPGASREMVEEAAVRANADSFIRTLPQGYDSVLGERGVNLSGGQKQRINIARALLRRPKILIMDEPTSALDAESEGVILEALRTSFRELTCIVIAHRLSTVMAADQIFVLDDGKLIQQGTHLELLQKDGIYRALCVKQFIDN